MGCDEGRATARAGDGTNGYSIAVMRMKYHVAALADGDGSNHQHDWQVIVDTAGEWIESGFPASDKAITEVLAGLDLDAIPDDLDTTGGAQRFPSRVSASSHRTAARSTRRSASSHRTAARFTRRSAISHRAGATSTRRSATSHRVDASPTRRSARSHRTVASSTRHSARSHRTAANSTRHALIATNDETISICAVSASSGGYVWHEQAKHRTTIPVRPIGTQKKNRATYKTS
jgi:hypothetical protein